MNSCFQIYIGTIYILYATNIKQPITINSNSIDFFLLLFFFNHTVIYVWMPFGFSSLFFYVFFMFFFHIIFCTFLSYFGGSENYYFLLGWIFSRENTLHTHTHTHQKMCICVSLTIHLFVVVLHDVASSIRFPFE